jgi:hypothetical protein
LSINKILVLDRNIVSLIKDANALKRQSSNEKVKMLSYLKRSDRKVIAVTPMLSIIEGQKGREESWQEMEKTIKNEAYSLKDFFSKAKVDSNFLLANSKSTSEIFIDSNATYKVKYDLFLKEVNPILVDKTKQSQKTRIKNEIIGIAKKHEIPTGHPVVMCCISALFGSDSSRKILKFKKNDYSPYNARNDLLVVSWFYGIKHRAKKVNSKITVKYLTLDKCLNAFLSMITVNQTTLFSDQIEIVMSYKKELFPDLSNEQYLELNQDCDE